VLEPVVADYGSPRVSDLHCEDSVLDPVVRSRAYIQRAGFRQGIGQILERSEALFLKHRPDRLLVLGDTNSGMAAIVARQLGIPVYHMEAGNRCYDDRVPEEVNRRVIDHCSTVLMPYTERSRANLLREGMVRAGFTVRAFVLYNSFNSWGWLDHCALDVKGHFEVFAGDIRDPHGVRTAMRDCDAVLDDILQHGIPVRQILVEFHHRFAGVGSRLPVAPCKHSIRLATVYSRRPRAERSTVSYGTPHEGRSIAPSMAISPNGALDAWAGKRPALGRDPCKSKARRPFGVLPTFDLMSPVGSDRIRIAILQRVCPGYRVALFSALTARENADVRLFIGDDIPNTKVKSASRLDGIRLTRLNTRFVKLGRRTLPWHRGLVRELRTFNPDVMMCEGESHFLGYVQAIYYRARYGRRTALMHWCFIGLPGEAPDRRDFASRIKGYFRRHFDAFVVYSSFSRERLLALGGRADKVFVATNVGDVARFLALSDALVETKSQVRRRLGLPDRFTVLFAGTLDQNKRPHLMLDLARVCDPEQYSFVLAGSGALLDSLKDRIEGEGLSNVYLPGRIDLTSYYRAADVLLIPGRGGIVISEAMAGGLPVIVHQADGTEYDLVEHGVTGYRLAGGDVDDFCVVLESLRSQPDLAASMGARGRELVRRRFNEHNMIDQILHASLCARTARLQKVGAARPDS